MFVQIMIVTTTRFTGVSRAPMTRVGPLVEFPMTLLQI